MKSLLHWITDLVFPPRCVGCGALGADVCAECLRKLKPNKNGRSWIVSASGMDPLIAQLIYALKYRGIHGIADPLGDWMAGAIGLNRATRTMFGANPLIVPVPLHPTRLRERGYNQAALLAKRIAMVSAMPFEEKALERVRQTSSQVETHSREERLNNMEYAFACTHPEFVNGRDVILVDDVSTTGATLNDCARALRVAGAASVHAITLAHG